MFDFLFPSTNICDERQLHRPLFFFPCNIFLPRTIRCLHKRMPTHTLANGFVLKLRPLNSLPLQFSEDVQLPRIRLILQPES